jgi:hypothetical protein
MFTAPAFCGGLKTAALMGMSRMEKTVRRPTTDLFFNFV